MRELILKSDLMERKLFMAVISMLVPLMTGVLAQPVFGLEIRRGEAVQGGLVLLQAVPGATLTADGDLLMVSAAGLAVVGFHRDDTAAVEVIATAPDGSIETLTLTPQIREYQEQRIDGLPKKMVTPPEDVLARITSDREMVIQARSHATALDAFAGDITWPVKGIVTGVYGSRRILNGEPRAPHYGIDIAAAKGTPVTAPADGIIRMVEDLYFTGWTIILDHGHGLSSTFLHLDTTSVRQGEMVAAGQVIATVGSSGRSTGPHLDWRINLFGKRLDPMLIAGPMPQ